MTDEEKAFVIASIKVRIEKEEKDRKKLEAKQKGAH